MENSQENLQEIKVQPKKKHWFKRKKKLVIWLSIALVVVLLVVGGIMSGGKKAEYTTYITQKNDLKQSVDATGKIESAEMIDLNFKTTGRIQKIYINAGDVVRAGQRLASLESGALSSQVADAQAQLHSKQADHEKLLAGASLQDVNVLENKLEQERNDLYSAENNLENLKISKITELNNLKSTTLTTLKNELSTAQATLEEIDNTLNDDDAENTLAVQDVSSLISALNNQASAENDFDLSESAINLLDFYSADSEILNAVDELRNTLDLITITLNDTLDVLSYTIISSTLSETELDALKTNIKSKQSSVNTSKNSLVTAKANWTNKIVYYQDQITQYEAAIITAQNNFKISQAELDLKKSPPRQFEIDASLAKVESARAGLSRAIANLNDSIITAPINGTITKKNLETGEYSGLSEPVLEMVGESNLQIEVDIPESDITKISLGQDAEITLDAYTSDDIFIGKVIFIDPAETIISDVVYYKVKVQLDDVLEKEIKTGMTANLTICTNLKENVISVPARAIKTNNGNKYVEVLVGDKKKSVEKKNITTGMRGDEGIEIVSGLNEGEEVITFVKE